MMMMMMMVMMMLMMMNIMNEGASRAQASPAIPCTSEPKSRAQARRLPNSHPARGDGSAFAGARLSGVSLINPGAGPGPVALPEAFGGNRRLYALAAPAADPPPVHPRVHDYRCNLQCILRVGVQKTSFFTGFCGLRRLQVSFRRR